VYAAVRLEAPLLPVKSEQSRLFIETVFEERLPCAAAVAAAAAAAKHGKMLALGQQSAPHALPRFLAPAQQHSILFLKLRVTRNGVRSFALHQTD